MVASVDTLSALHDGELAPGERGQVEAHARECAACAGALSRWRIASDILAERRTARAAGRRPLRAMAVPVLIAFALLVTSSAAVASGLVAEVLRVGEAIGVASRTVELADARNAGLAVPTSHRLPGGWRLDRVELTRTEAWSSVDLQYSRARARGAGVTVFSGIEARPTDGLTGVVTVDGRPVEIFEQAESRKALPSNDSLISARFAHLGSTVIVRGFRSDMHQAELLAIVEAWIEQAR